MLALTFDGTWNGWREAARASLQSGAEPASVVFRNGNDMQQSLLDAVATTPQAATTRATGTVPKAFLTLGADVACHREPTRWDTLYRVLWRITHGERNLLDVCVDDDVYRLAMMAKAVRREGHKMRAFVRFRLVGDDAGGEHYIAWFEPEQDVVRREAPFFARRFPAMRWSILTPDLCVSWRDGAMSFADGVPRSAAPQGDDLESLWRTYYAHTFNPARASPKTMRAEMPRRYWKHLPEASLIAPLLRDAPARVREMVALQREADAIPGGARPVHEVVAVPHDEGVVVARGRSDRAREASVALGHEPGASAIAGLDVRLGTASWTDPTMTAPRVFYPDGIHTAEARLAYYASRFSMVEVDSTYYSLPSERVAELWAERTPPGFVFDIKAHALMTGHATNVRRLPADIRDALPRSLAGASTVRTRELPDELVDEVWRRFLSALQPLRTAGKLGALLLQLPRDCAPSDATERALARMRERAGSDLCAVEFRQASWVTEGGRRARTLDLCRAHDLAFVMVDAPPGFETSMPAMTVVTSDRLVVIRMHGRRTATWESPVSVVSERYRYLYDGAELSAWVPRIVDVAYQTQGVHVVMNNCHANYGSANADEITALIIEYDESRRKSRA
jgi:probable DNA metabolism protein